MDFPLAAPTALPEPAVPRSLELTIIVTRIVIVALVGVGTVVMPPSMRVLPVLLGTTVGVAAAYAIAQAYLGQERLGTPAMRGFVTGFDLLLTLAVAASTGGVGSPLIGLVVVAAIGGAIRLELSAAIATGVVAAVGLGVVIARAPTNLPGPEDSTVMALGWALTILSGVVLTGMLNMVERDEFRRRQAAQSRQRHADELREQVEAVQRGREEFLRLVVHEVGLPAAAITSLVTSLRHQTPAGDVGAHLTTRLDSHARHLQELVTSLEGVVGGEDTGDLAAVRPDDVDVAATITACIPEKHAGDVLVDVDEQITAWLDGPKLCRIVTNLVEHALRSHPLTQEPVEVRARMDGEYLHVAVLDRGPGMTPTEREAAFQRFMHFRDGQDGSRLGLWVTAELCANMGGTVRANRRLGGGLVVDVRLPATREASPV